MPAQTTDKNAASAVVLACDACGAKNPTPGSELTTSRRCVACEAMLTPLSAPARGQAGDACGADVEKFCKDVPAGGGRRYKCLKEHEKDLSEPCQKHIADVKTRVRGMHEACWDDVGRLCEGVRPGGGRW